MKRVLIAVGVLAALLVPLTAAAKVTRADKHNAKAECKALSKAAGKANFAALMHSSKRKAYGLCVKRKSREEARERQAAHNLAVQQCREETFTPGSEEMRSDSPPRNEFGQCVARKRHEAKEDMDGQDQERINAARACRAEQSEESFADDHGDKSFAEFYGTNHNDSNAFGKCVSSKAKSQHEVED
jgi:hypothetical protein